MTTKEQLEKIINDLQQLPAGKPPFLGIHYDEEERDESYYLAANKEGLILFARKLLEMVSANEAMGIDEHHLLSEEFAWLNSKKDTVISRVKIKEEEDNKEEMLSQFTGNRLQAAGCILIILLFVVIMIMGVVSLVRYVF